MINIKYKKGGLPSESIIIFFSLIAISVILFFINNMISIVQVEYESTSPNLNYEFPLAYTNSFLSMPLEKEDKKLFSNYRNINQVKDLFWLNNEKSKELIEKYKNNYVLWLITIFILFSLSYIYLPFFEIKISWFLWFKYDVFFLLALIIWLFLPTVKENFNLLLKILFISTWLLLIIFLPWYMFWDISTISSLLWYSDKVSTYEANSCISFAQNVSGQNRFQATFGWPIRFSVFLVTMFSLYIWYILTYIKTIKYRLLLIIIPGIFVILSIFFSYSKTSILWLLFSLLLFTYLYRKIILNKK